jgi:hypothetical protein
MVDHKDFRHLAGKVMDFENIRPEQGVQSVQKTWQFAQQLTVPAEHASMAAELSEFFYDEVRRIEAREVL